MHKPRLQEWSHGIKEEVTGTLKRYDSVTSVQVREELSIDQMEKQKLLLQPQKIERKGLVPVKVSVHWAQIGNSGCQEHDLAIGKSPTRDPTTKAVID